MLRAFFKYSYLHISTFPSIPLCPSLCPYQTRYISSKNSVSTKHSAQAGAQADATRGRAKQGPAFRFMGAERVWLAPRAVVCSTQYLCTYSIPYSVIVIHTHHIASNIQTSRIKAIKIEQDSIRFDTCASVRSTPVHLGFWIAGRLFISSTPIPIPRFSDVGLDICLALKQGSKQEGRAV